MYIPVIKNRSIELSVIKELLETGLSEKTIPLFEIVQQKTRSNSAKTYIDELSEIFYHHSHAFFLDFPKIQVISSTSQPVQEFLTLINRQKDYAYQQALKCKDISGIIPVISYGTKENLDDNILSTDIQKYHIIFNSIALRLTPAQYNKITNLSSMSISTNDYFILDIGTKNHTSPAFKKIYRDIKSAKKTLGFSSFIINSNRPATLYNKNLIDGEAIEEIDNSLLEMYSMSSYKFDGFGDYACIANTLPSVGGAISPAGIYYSADDNVFIGYKGRTPDLSEFSNYIAPAIIASNYWAEFSKVHHTRCPGCKKIKAIANGASGKNQGIWKGITMNHYIYTVDQIMKNT